MSSHRLRSAPDAIVTVHTESNYQPLKLTKARNGLGTFTGSLIPCAMSILSAVMFLRIGWATGEAGIIATLGMLAIGVFLTGLTALSLAAIATNGDMGGGGTYYMISRSLGPEYGGAIGLCFYLAYCTAVGFHTTFVGTEIQQTWLPEHDASPQLTITWLSSLINLGCLGVSLGGAKYVTKLNISLVSIEIIAVLIGLISFMVPHAYDSDINELSKNRSVDFPHRFHENLWPDYDTKYVDGASSNPCNGVCDFQTVFAIIFPMVIGIEAATNLSGDLKNPAKSIPIGTLGGIAISSTLYVLIILVMGGAFTREALVSDLVSFQNGTLGSKYIIVFGILIAAFSSALGAMFGGSRVMQAIARDNLFPFLKRMGYGAPQTDEPVLALVLSWLVGQCVIMIGSVDAIAPVITSFFCLAYALVNMTCLLLSVTGVPNFRPSFHYFNAFTAFMGLANSSRRNP